MSGLLEENAVNLLLYKPKQDPNFQWKSSGSYLLAIICAVISSDAGTTFTKEALSRGCLGTILCLIVATATVLIPMMYMELAIGQYSQRNYIKMWQHRPYLTVMSIIMSINLIGTALFLYVEASLLMFYLTISFESPPPYTVCGKWSDENCNLLKHNFTVLTECIHKYKMHEYQCRNYTLTYPETQFWHYEVLNQNRGETRNIKWRMSTGAGIVSTLLFVMTLKGRRSIECVLKYFTSVPYFIYICLLIVTLLQPGANRMSGRIFDVSFHSFSTKFSMYEFIAVVIHSTGLGSGLLITMASESDFRSPCHMYSVTVAISYCLSCILFTVTTAIAIAPHMSLLGLDPIIYLSQPTSLMFVKIPRAMSDFSLVHLKWWLIAYYGANCILGFRSMTLRYLELLDILLHKLVKIRRYYGLITFFISLALFFLTIAMTHPTGFPLIRSYWVGIPLLDVFSCAMESLLFVWIYGFNKFSEDIHFMLGLRPPLYFRIVWPLLFPLLGICFIKLLYDLTVHMLQNEVYKLSVFTILPIGVVVLGIMVSIVVLKIKTGSWVAAIQTHGHWGPCDEVLQRSRGMFSAHAMTKEYIYRQYNLRAGILERQRLSNMRVKVVII